MDTGDPAQVAVPPLTDSIGKDVTETVATLEAVPTQPLSIPEIL
jgi:hypothetical protein